MFVRIPAWAGPRTTIAINGKKAATSPFPGQFARIHRTWKKGDHVEVEFDMPTASRMTAIVRSRNGFCFGLEFITPLPS